MRISLLEKRENFYQLLEDTLVLSSYFKEARNKKIKFYVNRYLNYISSSTLPTFVFQVLINEYSTSLTWWRKIIQSVYVKLATTTKIRTLFSHKTIKLSSLFSNYLILGGNHRLRLFPVEQNNSIVILKKRERKDFIKNDITLRKDFDITYSPKLLEFGEDWFKEEYVEGTPINRLGNDDLTKNIIQKVIKNHWFQLIQISNEKMTQIEYNDFIWNEISTIITNKNIKTEKSIIVQIKQVFDLLFEQLTGKDVDIAWSHGDLQQANILLKDNQYKVIDWEAANKRFTYYDVFTLLSEVRTGISLVEAIKKYKINFSSYKILGSYIDNDIFLLLIEELRYRVNEDFSKNFYFSGKNTANLCNQILEFINQ